MEHKEIKKFIKYLGYKYINNVPTYELVEHNIPKRFWTRGQLIDYICFLEDNCDH